MGREPRLPPHALRVALASRAGLGQILRGGARAWEAWLPHVVPRVGRLLRVLLLLNKKEWGTKTGAPPEPTTPYGRNKATLSAALSLLARPRDGGPAGRDLRPVLYLHVRGRWSG